MEFLDYLADASQLVPMSGEKGRLYRVIEDKTKVLIPQNTFSYDLGVADTCKLAREQLEKANADFPDELAPVFKDYSGESPAFNSAKFLRAVKEWRQKWFG